MTEGRCCKCNPEKGCNCKSTKCPCKKQGRACMICMCGPRVCKNWIGLSQQNKLRFTKDSIKTKRTEETRSPETSNILHQQYDETKSKESMGSRVEAQQHEETQEIADRVASMNQRQQSEIAFDEIFSEEEIRAIQQRILGMTTEQDRIRHCVWRERWMKLVKAIRTPRAYSPSGSVGRDLCQTFANLIRESTDDHAIPDSKCIVFMIVMLQKQAKKMTAKEFKGIVAQRLQQWNEEQYDEVIEEALQEERKHTKKGYTAPPIEGVDLERRQVTFSRHMKEGKIREAVRRSSSKSEITLLDPWSTITTPDSESKKVIDVLREKHPAPAPVYKEAVKEVLEYEELPQPKVIDITAADIERQASFLSGSGGPSRIDASCLKRLLLTHGEPSKDLREQLARRANMIAKEQVEWARKRSITSVPRHWTGQNRYD